MSGRIKDEDIAAVRERAHIVDVVQEHVALRNAGGGSMKGLCPFHDEKSPSFNVSPARNVFHCFGCGVGGDVIKFVMDIEHLTFAEAVERLAEKAGVQLRYEEGGPATSRPVGQRSRLVAASVAAAEFYAEQLSRPDAGPAREFLTQRGFDQATAQAYGCGFAPAGWDELTKHLLAKNFSRVELVTAGLARDSRNGNLIDRFHRRLLWPIKDITGDVVGFGARKLFDDDDGPKYLNTPETPIYKKSHMLYGVDLAKREIARRHQAVVVEGYTDVMACHLSGVPTAVATCGTAFGADHISVLRRLLMDQEEFRGEVIFTFDGDEAGQKAAMRAFDDDQRFVSQTFVAIEPSGMDPCELRQAKGDTAVRDLVARREPLFAFVLRTVLQRYDLETAEGRVAALDKAAPLVARIRDRSLRPEYARRLAGDLGMEVEPVLRRVGEISGGGRRPGQQPVQPVREDRPDPADPNLKREREALKLALQAPVFAGPVFDAVDESAYTHPKYVALRQAVAAAGGASAGVAGPVWVEKVAAACIDEVARGLAAELAVEPLLIDDAPDVAYASTVLSRLQEMAVTRQIVELKSKLQRVNPVEHPAKHTKLFGELISLEQYRIALREKGIQGL
ncbi:MAG: DNA primase [Mycobacteriales bacterium]